MSHYLLFRGLNFSLLLHGIVVIFIVYVGNHLPDVTPPLKIDFSIESDTPAHSAADNSRKIPEPARERENSRAPIKKVDPAPKPRQMEKKIYEVSNKPRQEEPAPAKPEVEKIEPRKLAPLHTKKRLVVEEKVRATAGKQFPASIPVEIEPQEIDPASVGRAEKVLSAPEEVPTLIPATAPAIEAQSPAPKEQYIEVNLSYIRDAVERATRYPDMARRMGWEGQVIIAFIVCPDGLVEDIRVIKSCGFKALDKNAIDTIKRCAPFPKPPLRAEITLPITYRLN